MRWFHQIIIMCVYNVICRVLPRYFWPHNSLISGGETHVCRHLVRNAFLFTISSSHWTYLTDNNETTKRDSRHFLTTQICFSRSIHSSKLVDSNWKMKRLHYHHLILMIQSKDWYSFRPLSVAACVNWRLEKLRRFATLIQYKSEIQPSRAEEDDELL